MARTDYVKRLVAAAPTGSLSIIGLGDGWPSRVRLTREDHTTFDFTVHASAVSSHARKPHEFRFQNPGSRKAVSDKNGIPVLIGLYQVGRNQPVFVGVDGQSRVGRDARFSILFDKRILDEASATGWATYTSSTGEQITAFNGALAAAFLESVESSRGAGPEALGDLVRDIGVAVTEELQLPDVAGTTPIERVRVVATRIARSSQFARKVLQADGAACAFCGMSGPLLQAAHVLPVSSPESNDSVSNGITLCANHHVLFDAHHIFVDPVGLKVRVSPTLKASAAKNAPLHSLISALPTTLPARKNAPQVSVDMLRRRYAFYPDKYPWV